MLFSQAGLLLTTFLSTTVLAAPTEDAFRGIGWGVNRGHNWGRTAIPQSCNTAAVQMPQAPQPLPPPTAGLTLYHVALGRGTQNYTCDQTNTTSIPVAAGAVASLWNVTCLSADSPSLLSAIPNIALALPVPQPNSPTAYNALSGHHYFSDATTAYFDLDTALGEYGRGGFKKVNATPAPSDAVKGQRGQGYGSVPWLKLVGKGDEGCEAKEIYRINTAGGNPPKTCAGMGKTFEVEYSAEYWFYA
ncbi:unnamed protein product [Zymoseptoria tritici ST99CH_3D7]|uniref:Malate dehydrogenase n=1 Tax=Zymoseptoria tritici (strain ST99CH_3D7) TaxID=1276538 RepID=A0A1X7RJP0_ZYMT9|nr:unnamed protein product [Zymoseptoria tritici ST99CH_3D7]